MKLFSIPEPKLVFAGGKKHIDIRAGIADFGTFDKGGENVPKPIRLGIIGTAATVDGIRDWLDSCKNGVESLEGKLREFRPSFPGMKSEVFGTTFDIQDNIIRKVSQTEILNALRRQDPLRELVTLFFEHARDLTNRGSIHVLLVAPPSEVFDLESQTAAGTETELDESQDTKCRQFGQNFHDLFKAEALSLHAPCQLVRPDTYGGGSTKRRPGTSIQPPAGRAWNLHAALYYKAGGIPWRLEPDSSRLATCYVGASFFKSVDGKTVLTSVAQVFNERGEGLIVQGGNARVERSDNTPHLTEEESYKLLTAALASYRREHRTVPARLVIHKTSYFDDAEIAGCKSAADENRIELLDLVSVRRSRINLLNSTVVATPRGTMLQLDKKTGLLYLSGTVPYYKVYPGMYIPRPLEFTLDYGEVAPLDLAREILELSKLNFNNTRFDGGDPITIRAARHVGDILKHVEPTRNIQSRFRYFI